MSDRIAVMSNARIAQIGSPAEIYERPRTPFVAKFIGESNFLEGAVEGEDGNYLKVRCAAGTFRAPRHPAANARCHVALRPERVLLDGDGENSLPGTILQVVYRGEMLHVRVSIEGGEITVATRNEGQLRRPVPWSAGDAVRVTWHPDDVQVLEPDPS